MLSKYSDHPTVKNAPNAKERRKALNAIYQQNFKNKSEIDAQPLKGEPGVKDELEDEEKERAHCLIGSAG